MKSTILSVGLVGALFTLVLQLPIVSITMQAQEQLAAVLSRSDYGTQLGITIDEVVKSLRFQDKRNGDKSYITHRHIMAMMCQENPKLNIRVNNGQGFSRGNQEGLTQVIDKTAKGLLYGGLEKGRCAYIKQLENGVCADIRARINNPRCSIELGACYLNEKLKQAKGDPYRMFVGYNTGNVNRTSRVIGGSSFNRGYNALANGKLCAKARANPQTWIAMYKKIAELTGGTFKTNDAEHIPISSIDWPKDPSRWPTPKNIGSSFWQSSMGRAVSSAIGGGEQQKQQSRSPSRPPFQQSGQQSPLGRANASWLDRLLGRVGDTPTSTPKASLSCDEQGGKIQLHWSCPSGTTVSRGFGTLGVSFDTHGAGAGSVRSSPVGGAEYILQCIKGHQLYAEAKCSPPIVESVADNVDGIATDAVVYDIIPKGVVMRIEYDTGRIIWATLGTRECQLTAGNARKLGKSGSLPIGEPAQDILIKLECNTIHGKAVKYKKIVVE